MENRLELIYDAASQLFINKGYGRTQIRDIAKEIGLSTGMIYQYFSGKRDILSFILKGTIDPSFFEQELHYPIDSTLFDNLEDEIMETFEQNQGNFDGHLKNQAVDYPLKAMLSDAFDIVSNYAVSCLIIEHNGEDLKELSFYYRDYRKRFLFQIQQYIELYIEKEEFRKVENTFYTARAVTESLAWWGMHIRYDAFEPDRALSRGKAKEICLDLLLHAYGI
ncbi:TetR/AcrR family transcriptional regulator [Enterococcus raffinosus]|uniref:TetR family transcriptional regulator n=1 Tax=Enterococcus raffinosus TaxID=71452 RepID=UPI001C0FFB1B|nr:TetR family transcriptional regulator [Enterococcus raffinosus]MBU5361127.1 TetR/AcrR family transcriptional regulator [Enterococcus raffinosus]